MAAAKGRVSDKHLSNLGARTAGVASSVLLGRILTYLIAGIALIVVSRLLASTVFGLYVLATSVSGIFISVGNLGISQSFSKFVAEYRAKKQEKKLNEVISGGYILTILSGIILSLMVFGLSAFISHLVFGTLQYSYLISAVSVIIIGSMVFNISYYALISFGRKNAIVGIIFLQVLAQAIFSIILAVYHFEALAPIIGLAVGYLLGTIASLVYMAVTEKIKFVIPSWSATRELLVFSLPLGVYNVVNGIAVNLQNLILGAFSSASVVGNVAISQRIGSVINSANESVAASLVPLFASAVEPGVKSVHISKLYNYSLYITFVLFAPAALFLAFFAKEITFIALGIGYPTAQYYLPIVSIGLMLFMITDYTTSLMVGRNKVRPIMKFGSLAYILEIIVLLLLVPTFKGYGMVVAASIVLPITLLLFYHKSIADDLNIKFDPRRPIQVVIMALIATVLVAPVPFAILPVSLINDIIILVVTAVLLIIIYPPLLTLTGTMVEKDISIIKKTSAGIPVAGKILYLLCDYAERFARN